MADELRRPQRWDLSQRVVRRNAPRRPFGDFYYHLLEGPWWRLLASFGLLYLVLNFIFAFVFWFDVGGIDNARSFADHFFFSVQTLSTIGYGVYAPTSAYANFWVTIEAMVGMLFVAISTGFMIAKASKPTTQIIFSNSAVVGMYKGKPTLMFRVGNLRGNEIAEAEVGVNALVEDVNPEGINLRRLHSLKLVRRDSPIFSLSWSVMHVVDENSPLLQFIENKKQESLRNLIVVVTGHDATFGQTIYARHMYYPEDIRFGERLVDVIHDRDDGRIEIDFSSFHDTEPE